MSPGVPSLLCGIHIAQYRTDMNATDVREREPQDPLAKWRGRGRLPLAKDADEYLRRIREGARNRPHLYPKMPRVLPEGSAARLLDEERGDR